MFAVMRDTDYAQKKTFLSNFWEDWKKILGPDHVIQNLEQCDFTPIYEWHLVEKEKKKQLSSEVNHGFSHVFAEPKILKLLDIQYEDVIIA